ncbi:hypothetical protein BJF78_17540 [Pseudonocardia sp. CNS-139]|nr:hypothetical protein BJF78_17540 [Pseudonocardia sp. CNS-139]
MAAGEQLDEALPEPHREREVAGEVAFGAAGGVGQVGARGGHVAGEQRRHGPREQVTGPGRGPGQHGVAGPALDRGAHPVEPVQPGLGL